jgi:hypothetical protein
MLDHASTARELGMIGAQVSPEFLESEATPHLEEELRLSTAHHVAAESKQLWGLKVSRLKAGQFLGQFMTQVTLDELGQRHGLPEVKAIWPRQGKGERHVPLVREHRHLVASQPLDHLHTSKAVTCHHANGDANRVR